MKGKFGIMTGLTHLSLKGACSNSPGFNINQDPNWQVKTFTKYFLNIMANHISNEIKRIIPRDPPWITKPLKIMLNRKNRFFKNHKRHGYKQDKVRLDNFHKECLEAVENDKLTYLVIWERN